MFCNWHYGFEDISVRGLAMDALNKYLKYFGFILVGLILVLGFVLIFSDYFNYIPKNFRIIFASVIISYGVFRMVTLIYKPKTSADDE